MQRTLDYLVEENFDAWHLNELKNWYDNLLKSEEREKYKIFLKKCLSILNTKTPIIINSHSGIRCK